MFEIPEAKRVRREDIFHSDADSMIEGAGGQIDTDLGAQLNAQIAKSLGMDAQETRSSPKPPPTQDFTAAADDDNQDEDVGEFEFRLFSSAAPAKIILEDESRPQKEGTILHRRPAAYYVANNIPETKRNEYRLAAVSGEDIMAQSHRPSWGLEYRWKVTTISATPKARLSQEHKVTVSSSMEGNDVKKRKRPGKRSRIAQRHKIKTKKEKEAADKKKAMDKEEHLKEKKKRMNRLKKLRKRAKNKDMKAGKEPDEGSDGASGGD